MRHRRLFLLLVASLLLACTAVAPMASAARPKVRLVKIIKAPPARTGHTKALFRFKRARATKTRCRVDRRRYRRCRSRAKYRALRPGRHVFRLRARRGGRTVVVRRRWTIVKGDSIGAPLPPPGKLLFDEEFNGPFLNTLNWSPYNSLGHAGNGLRRPSALTVSNGMLAITANMVYGQLVSGGMSHRRNYIYGRYEFRVRTDTDPTGTTSGIVLTWPQRQWSPEFTENDVYETGAGRNTRWPFRTFIHYGRTNSQKYFDHRASAAQWHTMTMDWRRSALKIYRDGVLVWALRKRSHIPDVPHHVSIQLDARSTRTLTTPVRMYVDYVRIYE